MKKFVIAALAIGVCVLSACTKKAAFDENAVFLGDAVTADEVTGEAQDGWEQYQKDALSNVKTDGSKDVGDAFLRDKEEEVVALVNNERAKAGLGALTIDNAMMSGAEIRAEEQKKAFSHTRPDGRTCDTVYDDLSIPCYYYGENLGMGGSTSASGIVDSWMNSAGHRANIMDGEFTRIGVGCFESGGCVYWAQIFAD